MKNRLAIIALAVMLALPLVAQPASGIDDKVDFARLAPPETTFFIQVTDMTRLKKDWLNTSLGKHYQQESIQRQTAPLQQMFFEYMDRYLTAFFISHETVDKLFEHQVAMYINDLHPLGSSYSYEICLIVERGDKNKEEYQSFIDQMLATFPERAERNVLKVEGVDIFQVKFQQEILLINDRAYEESALADVPEEILKNLKIERKSLERNAQYAFIDDIFLICDGYDMTLTRAVKQLKNASEAGLDTQDGFRRVTRRLQQTAGADNPPAARIWMNFESYAGYLSEKAKAAQADEAPMKRLGYDIIQGLGAELYFDGADAIVVGTAQCSSLDRGIPSLLPLLGANQLAATRSVPADAISYNSLALDAPALYRKLFSFLEPNDAELIKANLQQLLPDFDIENDLLSALGQELGLFFAKPTEEGKEMEATFLMEVADEQKITNAIQRYTQNPQLQNAGIVTTNESYKGYTINTLGPAETTQAVSRLHWVIADRQLFAGSDLAGIKQAIRVKRGEENNFTSSSPMRRARQLLPEKCDYLEVINLQRKWPLGGSFSIQLLENYLRMPILPRPNPGNQQNAADHELDLLLLGGKVRNNGLDLKILAKGAR